MQLLNFRKNYYSKSGVLTNGCRGISKVFTEAGVLIALLRDPAEEFLVLAETVLVSGDAAGLGGTTGI